MPCHSAMTSKLTMITPDESVASALKLMKKNKAEFMPVVDEDGILQGLFSYAVLLKNLLPVSVAGGVALRAAPGIVKRLRNAESLPVSDFMQRKVNVVYPQTPTWEGINLLMTHGSPLLVVENEGGKLLGLITAESAFDELQRLKDSES